MGFETALLWPYLSKKRLTSSSPSRSDRLPTHSVELDTVAGGIRPWTPQQDKEPTQGSKRASYVKDVTDVKDVKDAQAREGTFPSNLPGIGSDLKACDRRRTPYGNLMPQHPFGSWAQVPCNSNVIGSPSGGLAHDSWLQYQGCSISTFGRCLYPVSKVAAGLH